MGSGFKDFTAGSVLTASDMNNFLMEQSVMRFATTAARDLAITSPEDGMIAYIGSNDANEGFYTFNGTSWRRGPGWNAPWGFVVQVAPTVATFNTTRGFSGNFNVTMVQNRLYKFSITGFFENVSVTGVVDTLSLHTSAGTLLADSLLKVTQTTANGQNGATGTAVYTATTTGTVVHKLGAISSASATNQTFNSVSVIVEDVGANGVPV